MCPTPGSRAQRQPTLNDWPCVGLVPLTAFIGISQGPLDVGAVGLLSQMEKNHLRSLGEQSQGQIWFQASLHPGQTCLNFQGFDPCVRKTLWRRKWQPTQCSCLENPMARGAWWAAPHGVTRSRTLLSH